MPKADMTIQRASKHDKPKLPLILMQSPNAKWPVVSFSTVYGHVPVLCIPNPFEVNNAEGDVEARREQVC